MIFKRYFKYSYKKIVETTKLLSSMKRIGFSTIKLYVYLSTKLLPESCGKVQLSADQISKDLKISTRQVSRSIQELKRYCILVKQGSHMDFKADSYLIIEEVTEEDLPF